MIRPTCTGPALATVDGQAGRWRCTSVTPRPMPARLALLLTRSASLDELHRALVVVEHAAIHCRIDEDEREALARLHREVHRRLMRRELQSSPGHRSVLMLVRAGAT